jgi:uncharacterized protein (TIGR03000 family)
MTHLFPRFPRAAGLIVCSTLVWALGTPTDAHASGFFGFLFGHGSHGSSGGWYGGSSGGWYGGSSGGYGGSYGSSGGWYGGGSSGGWYGGSYGSGGGWYGGSSGGAYYGNGHHGNEKDNDQPPPPGPATRLDRRSTSQVARVIVKVPAQAKVYMQDQPMTLGGATRQFVSPRLEPNRDYEYTVRVELQKDGQKLTKTAKARVRAGQRVEVVVNFAENDPNQLVASVQRR